MKSFKIILVLVGMLQVSLLTYGIYTKGFNQFFDPLEYKKARAEACVSFTKTPMEYLTCK